MQQVVRVFINRRRTMDNIYWSTVCKTQAARMAPEFTSANIVSTGFLARCACCLARISNALTRPTGDVGRSGMRLQQRVAAEVGAGWGGAKDVASHGMVRRVCIGRQRGGRCMRSDTHAICTNQLWSC